jgi:hypothetical protein
MIFEVNRKVTQIVDDQPTESILTTEYRAELENGVFDVYETIENIEYKVINQPWNFTEDGQRIDWNSIEQGIEWFKQLNGHVEE